MRFNDLPPEIINEIYSYLTDIFIYHCNLTAAARLASQLYNINEQVYYIKDDAEFEITSVELFHEYVKLRKNYINLVNDLDIYAIARQFGCKCKLRSLVSSFYSENEIYYMHNIIYDLLNNKSLKSIYEKLHARIIKYYWYEQKYINILRKFIFDVYVHFLDEEKITDEIKQTRSYYKRLLCRNTICKINEILFETAPPFMTQFESE